MEDSWDVMDQISALHEDRPEVVIKLKKAFAFMQEVKNNPNLNRRERLESLLTILEYCGDYSIQNGVLRLIISHDDVKIYKEWFAKLWFTGMPQTVADFISLVQEDGSVSAVDISNFLTTYNMEQPVMNFVMSMPAFNLKFSKVPLPQPIKEKIMVHLNCGTRTLSVTGLRSIPKELVTRGTFFLRSGEVQSALVHTLLDPYGTETQLISVTSSVGHLLFSLDPILSHDQLQTFNDFFNYIFQVRVQFSKPAMHQQQLVNVTVCQDLSPLAGLENQEQIENSALPSSQPAAKSLVSSSSQDNFSINCLEPRVLPNQEDIQMCNQFARGSSNSSANQLSLSNTVQPDIDHEPVGSSCDNLKPKGTKRRGSSIKQNSKKFSSDSETEMAQSSTQDVPHRRETRSMSNSRGQALCAVAEEPLFKQPKQQRGRGRGRGRANSLNRDSTNARAEITEITIPDDPVEIKASTSNTSPPVKQISPEVLKSECVPPAAPASLKQISSEVSVFVPEASPSDNDGGSLLTMVTSHPTNGVNTLLSMPTLDTPYATPVHDVSYQSGLKITPDNVNSQPIQKSHENLLNHFEEEALRAGPPPALPIYPPLNFAYDTPIPDEAKKNDDVSESDTSLLESTVHSAVLLPDQYVTDPAMCTPSYQSEPNQISGSSDEDPLKLPLKLDECTGAFV